MEGKIYQAISAVMDDIGAVGKDSVNTFDKYKFRGIDAVMNALNPAMRKNHVFVTPSVLDAKREERESKNGGTMMYSILTVKYTFFTDDGSSVESIVIGEAMDRSDKSTNKAMSAAFKYACFQTFCIPTEEMVDADAESPEIGQKVKKETKAEKPASKQSEDDGMTEEEYTALLTLMARKGIDAKILCSTYKVESLITLTHEQYENAIARLNKSKDKE